MNLRTLKKLSKRAAPLLGALGDRREQFAAARGENYTGQLIMARKHFERGRSVHDTCASYGEIKTPARDGHGWVYMCPPCHPLKGTVMVGGMDGYYEPEWSEETAWEALTGLVAVHFTDWSNDPLPARTRRFRTPSDWLRGAADMARDLEGRCHG